MIYSPIDLEVNEMGEKIALRTSVHMHTYASDGIGSLSDICRAAAAEGIDCVVISDHETVGHNFNGYADKTLVVTGEEITPGYSEELNETGGVKAASGSSHILTIGLKRAIQNEGRMAQELIDQVNLAGGLSFIAHPEEPGHFWEQWPVTGFTGIEIWTYKAAWKTGAALAPSKTYAWRNPDSVLAGPSVLALRIWDEEGQKRRVVGLGCSDQHGFPLVIDGIQRKVFDWAIGLTGIVSYVLVDMDSIKENPVSAFLAAIRGGRVIIAHDGLALARGFTAKTVGARPEQVFWPGDEVPDELNLSIQIESHRPVDLRIIKNGEPYQVKHAQKWSVPIDGRGVWRVEAYLDGHPWIYTNPFYVGGWRK